MVDRKIYCMILKAILSKIKFSLGLWIIYFYNDYCVVPGVLVTVEKEDVVGAGGGGDFVGVGAGVGAGSGVLSLFLSWSFLWISPKIPNFQKHSSTISNMMVYRVSVPCQFDTYDVLWRNHSRKWRSIRGSSSWCFSTSIFSWLREILFWKSERCSVALLFCPPKSRFCT